MRYDYTVMPGQNWYGPKEGQFLEETCATYREAVQAARDMFTAGVRDIVINAYDLAAEELADFYYKVDDESGKVIKR